jgi:hypothetical protein
MVHTQSPATGTSRRAVQPYQDEFGRAVAEGPGLSRGVPALQTFYREGLSEGQYIRGPMTPFAPTDFRDAVRGLRRTPTVTLCAVACLTLGLGATTAIASAIDQALIRQLPFRDPGKLITV